MRTAIAAALFLTLPAAGVAQEAAEDPVTPASVVAASKPDEWTAIDPADLIVMDLAPDPAGKERRVIIQLIPAPFSQGWVDNIRKLAQAHWWDGTSVYRVVDNWVAQWGDVEETKVLPEGVSEQGEAYSIERGSDDFSRLSHGFVERARERAQAERRNAALDAKEASEPAPSDGRPRISVRGILPPMVLLQTDSYAQGAAFYHSWPISLTGEAIAPTHCYGSVGVARSVGSGGTGSELYAVIGHAPRQLDRNIAVVGRVIEGIEHLSTLPRGPASTNGVYEDAAQRVPIISARLGNELSDPPRFQYLDSDSQSFADYVHVRANRHDPFYLHPAGGIDVCNVQPPIRRVPNG